MTDHDRHDELAARIGAMLHADAMRAVADPDDPFTLDDVTSFRVEVTIEPAEIDPDTGDVYTPERITARAFDVNHHSNVLHVELTEDGLEVE